MSKTIIAKQPCFFTEAELQDFMALVRAGGEVGDAVIDNNVRSAKCLAFLRQGDCLSGIAALKKPLLSYREKIEKKSGVAVEVSEFSFELGYVFVLPSARLQGFSIELTAAALSAAENEGVFATSRTNNDGMHSTLGRFGFNKAGSVYASRNANHHLQLFLRPAAQPGAAGDAPQAARP